MKCSFFRCLLCLTSLCLLFSQIGFAQNDRPSVASAVHAENLQYAVTFSAPKKAKPPVLVEKKQSAVQGICDNDVVAPEVKCASNNCHPFARAVYLTTANYQQPWGQDDNNFAMEAVFGPGTWEVEYLEFVDPAVLLTPFCKVIFLEGSQYAGPAMVDFLAANLAGLENWVAAGGALFINSCPVNTQTFIDFGFGGVSFQSQVSGNQGYVQAPAHPIFNGPFTPANGGFSGAQFFEFQYGAFSGDVGQVLISGNGVVLAEKKWGKGKVYFGAIIPPSLDAPQPNVQNMWRNILVDLNNHCNASPIVSADPGACVASILDPSLDATATDDCILVSFTHDFASAPSNTSLNGAVLPIGNTLIRWTATDAAGNTGTCEETIIVRELELPVITCPADISVDADLGSCGKEVVFDFTLSDNCTATPTITVSMPSGSLFPNGSTQVIATAMDESSNVGACAFTINVAGNPEICNGIDDNCDGWVDETVTEITTFYLDADYDGYGDPTQTVQAMGCTPPWGYSINALDCDDANYYISPAMSEYCNGIDDNCDGNIDEGVAPTWYADTDHDGYGDQNTTLISCDQPQGYVINAGDCSDTDAYIHPGAMEDCTNLVDENCDGLLGDNNFSIEETHTDVFCGSNPDGSISITINPAQNYPVILWSNGNCCSTELINLDFGTYKVTVTNECGTSKTKSIVIQESAEPPLQVALTGTVHICYGTNNGFLRATVSDGCGGYTYQWNTGSTDAEISGLAGGYYFVIVTDACGCTRVADFTVYESPQLNLYFVNIIPLLDGTYFVQVVPDGGTAPYKFRRSIPAGGFTDWSSSNGFLGVPFGDFVFEVEDAHGCTAQNSITLTPFSPRPLDNQDPDQAAEKNLVKTDNREDTADVQAWQVSLFPNPNSGFFSLDLFQPASAGVSFGICDQNGRLLIEMQAEAGIQVHNFNTESLPSGMYFLQVISEGKVVAIAQFVKQ